jgi:Xaa-Pro aminopeptidase
MVLVTDSRQTEFGRFLEFENMTWCHFERDLIDTSLLTDAEIAWVNQYHRQVYDRISPYLPPQIAAWLQTRTALMD